MTLIKILHTEQKLYAICSLNREHEEKKVIKGAWRMPWILEAMKDVISCDKLGGVANTR
jgi:hypothetical protein